MNIVKKTNISDGYANISGLIFEGSNKEIFSNNVNANIDIAFNNNCNFAGNGICTWCPKCDKKDPENDYIMPWATFEKIIIELKEANYSGNMSLIRYNEALLMDIDELCKRVKFIKDNLPMCKKIGFNTNGSLLTREKLDKLYNAGLTGMNIQIYPKNEKDRIEFGREFAEKGRDAYVKKLGVSLDPNKTKIMDGYYYEWKIADYGDDKQFVMYAKNLTKLGCNRAEAVKAGEQGVRGEPCPQIGHFLGIDANGDVSLCTNFTGALTQEHKPYIFGNINNEKIWDIYARGLPMIKSLTDDFDKDAIPTPCKTCMFKPHVAQVQAVKEILKTR